MLDSLVTAIKPQLPSIVRRAMTGAAAILGTYGVLPKAQSSQFIEVGTAIVLAAIPEVWSWISNKVEQRKLVAAAITGNPAAPPASKTDTAQAMAIVKAVQSPPPPPPPAVNINLNAANAAQAKVIFP